MNLSFPTAPRITVESVMAQLRAGLLPLKAIKPMPLSEWATKNFYLSAESTHVQGSWIAFPFQNGIMDWMSDDRITELAVKKSKRVGYTKMLLAYMAYNACHRRRKLGLWQPTDDDRDSFVKSEVEPMLRDVRAFRPVMRQTGGEDTMKLKQFVGSVWHLLGGKAARAYRRITLAVALLDELDGFDQLIEKSADAVTLAKGRLEGAPFPKLVCGSTPRVKGLSLTDDRYNMAGAQMQYVIACPHCDAEHPLIWGNKKAPHGIKWDAQNPAEVWHVCPHCRESIRQADYLKAAPEGAWVDVQGRYRYGRDQVWRNAEGDPCRPPAAVGAQIWAAYSPQRDWDDIVKQFLQSHIKLKEGDSGPMQGFVNETLGDVWEDAGDRAEGHVLMAKAERFRLRIVPRGVLKLVCGVDIQDNRFEFVVWGVGRGEETWTVDYQVLEANPADTRDWDKLDEFLKGRYPIEGTNRSMAIDAVAIDTGGHFTHHVYNFARERERDRVFAVRGDPIPGGAIKSKSKRVDVNWRGMVVRSGVKLWHVGTDTAKDLLFGRLQLEKPGPGFVHFSHELPLEFYEQLTAEVRTMQKTSTGHRYKWVPQRPRNEVLDCTVYAMFCIQALDLHRYSEAMWDKLEQALEPDLFERSQAQQDPEPDDERVNPRHAPVRPSKPIVVADDDDEDYFEPHSMY